MGPAQLSSPQTKTESNTKLLTAVLHLLAALLIFLAAVLAFFQPLQTTEKVETLPASSYYQDCQLAISIPGGADDIRSALGGVGVPASGRS